MSEMFLTKETALSLLRIVSSGLMKPGAYDKDVEKAIEFLRYGPNDPMHPEYVLSSTVWRTQDVLDLMEEEDIPEEKLGEVIGKIKDAFEQRDRFKSNDEDINIIMAGLRGRL